MSQIFISPPSFFDIVSQTCKSIIERLALWFEKVIQLTKISRLWGKLEIHSCHKIFDTVWPPCFSSLNFFDTVRKSFNCNPISATLWYRIVIQLNKILTMLDKCVFQTSKTSALCDKLKIRTSVFLTLWDKLVIHLTKVSTIRDKKSRSPLQTFR